MSRRGSTNGRGRHRRMYELTGIPGWIRFGSSMGNASSGRGFGPCAEYIEKTGQMSEFMEDLATRNPNLRVWQDTFSKMENKNPMNKKDFLEQRIRDLEDELRELKKQYKEVR